MISVDLSQWRFLVIDDVPVLRQSLRTIIQTMGGFEVDQAQGYADALYRMRLDTPDVVLCDYVLGDDRDGQQLLETVRRTRLIPDEAIWIMVTGEQAYEQVVACVELVPDDYIIKPFSPELLRLRLLRCAEKKAVFKPYYQDRRAGRFDAAASFLDKERDKPQHRAYRMDFLRLGAELTLMRGKPLEAERAYREILDQYPFPWANLGVARALKAQQHLEQARELIDTVVAEAPLFIAAAEFKSEICAEQGDYAAVQQTLSALDARNPRNLDRKRRLAAAAVANGDLATARIVLDDMLRRELSSPEADAADQIAVARVCFDAGDLTNAAAALAKVASVDTLGDAQRKAYVALNASLNPESGRDAFIALADHWLKGDVSEEEQVDALRAALALDEPELADRIAKRLMRAEGLRRVFSFAQGVYARHERGEQFRAMQRAAAFERIGIDP